MLIKYRWKRSVPADRAIGLGTAALRAAVDVERTEKVSEMVLGGVWERRRMRASIAATGIVKRGSVERRLW